MKTPSALGGGSTNAAISALGLTSQQIASFVITLLAAGFLSAAEYGVYTLAIVFVEFVVMLCYTGYFHFVVNEPGEDGPILATMFWIMTGIGTAGGLLLILSAGALARVFDAPDLAPVLRLFGLLQPFAAMIGWASAAMMRAGAMRRYFLILIASNLGGLAAGSIVLVMWQSLFALVVYRALRIALGVVLFAMALPQRPRFEFDRAMAIRASHYAGGLYGARFLTFLSTFGTDLILAFLFSTAESGLYRFANRLATAAIDIVAQPLRSFALKSFGGVARAGGDLNSVFAQYLSALLFFMSAFGATVGVLGHTLVVAFFQPEYLAALGAFYALTVRATGLAGNMLVEPVFAAGKNTYVGMYHNLFWTILLLVGIVLVAPYGFETLAVMQAVLALCTSCAALWVMSRWGNVAVTPALRPAAAGLGLVAVYGLVLWLCWQSILTALGASGLAVGAGVLVAIGLAAPTLFAAYKLKVIDPRLFSD
ncbi:MAG: oligosaccharide flippase family protein [Sulfitobacter sp.]